MNLVMARVRIEREEGVDGWRGVHRSGIVVARVLNIDHCARAGEWGGYEGRRNGDSGRVTSVNRHGSKSRRNSWIDDMADRTRWAWKSAVEAAGSGPGSMTGGDG